MTAEASYELVPLYHKKEQDMLLASTCDSSNNNKKKLAKDAAIFIVELATNDVASTIPVYTTKSSMQNVWQVKSIVPYIPTAASQGLLQRKLADKCISITTTSSEEHKPS